MKVDNGQLVVDNQQPKVIILPNCGFCKFVCMNFLAHLYLSGNDDQLKIGNFIADSVKGSDYNNYPEGIKRGILLHRAIDFYTDNHPVFLQSVARLRPAYRKFSGVIVDIFYDHFLAKNWKDYSEKPLEQYVKEIHKLLLKNILLMPEKSFLFLKYVIRTNRLVSYRNLDGIGEVLYGMSRRTKYKSNMEFAIKDLKEGYPLFENEFSEFFAELEVFVKEWTQTN